MEWFHCSKDDNNDDITQIEIANESDNGEVSRRNIRGSRKKVRYRVPKGCKVSIHVVFYVGKIML